MALAETAELAVRLSLDDQFSRGVAKAEGRLAGFGKTVGRIGSAASKGLVTAANNVAKIGAVGAVALGTQVKAGLESLAQLEDATTAVTGAIETMGLTGKLTAKEVATWANEIEAATDAAFDDKDITASAATLLRYGKVTRKNLRPALEVMTDLAAKTGSVESASTLLARALADPTKAAGKLARAGVILTKQQQKQITALVKAGKASEAQAVLLDALEKSTRGAAKASAGPYRDSLNILRDTVEDAQRALGEGFLPVITKVRDILQRELAKPETIANIREFGKSAARGLDKLIEVAQRIPWGQIGDSLKIAGAGAKAVMDAFLGLPPWVQTAVLTGWGLNKLTGGALGTIVGELGKGLIKGVLGLNAGVVNARAGVVNVSGPVTGGGTGAAGGGGGIAGAAKGVLGIGAVVAVTAVAEEEFGKARAHSEAVVDQAAAFVKTATNDQKKAALETTQAAKRDLFNLASLFAATPLGAITAPITGQAAVSLDKTEQLLSQNLSAIQRTTQETALTRQAVGSLAGDTRSEGSATRQAVTAAIRATDTTSEVIGVRNAVAETRAALAAGQTAHNQTLNRMIATTQAGDSRSEAALARVSAVQAATKATIAAGDTRSEAALSRLQGATNTLRTSLGAKVGAVVAKVGTLPAAFMRARPIVNTDVNVRVNVSARQNSVAAQKTSRYGYSHV